VEELAKHVGRVTFYLHGQSQASIEDFTLSEPLVRCVDLGPRPRLRKTMLGPGRSFTSFRPHEDGIDLMLIRGPTPLLPHLVKACGHMPVALHIVADYVSAERDPEAREWPWWRDALLGLAFRMYQRQQRRASQKALVLVNAPHLRELFPGREVPIVIESTLTQDSIVAEPRRKDAKLGDTRPLRLLLAGRIVPEKGLWEAAEAVRLLVDLGYDTVLDIVGWEAPTDPLVDAFWAHVRRHDVEERVRFIGYVPAGPQLAAIYQQADIYVLPSRAEAFPRTIVEAMGAGIPVVTTPVGGIPRWIHHEQEAILVEPRSATAVADGIRSLLEDDDLHDRVARGGWEFARRFTLERACEDLARRLSAWSQGARAAATSTSAPGAEGLSA